jgi:hypothetical protein
MINTTYIYFLHKGDNIPFYIGKTLTPLETRLKHHKWKFKNSTLQISLIDEVLTEEWKFWEEWYIELFLCWGFNLYGNKTKKGRGPGNRVCTWGDKISQSTKGKTKNYSIEEREKRKQKGKIWGYSNKGSKYNNEQKELCKKGKRKYINQYSLNGEFIKEWYSTQTEICLFYNYAPSSLSVHLKGEQKSALGFIWKLKE